MSFSEPVTPTSDPQEIGILLVPEFSMLCFSSVIEPLRAVNRTAGTTLYQRRIYAMSGGPVTASNGLKIEPDAVLTGEEKISLLLVCSSFRPERYLSANLAHVLRRHRRRGTVLGALDTGSIILAESGLLDGYRATIHWELLDSFAEDFPAIDVAPDRFVIDRNRITAGGGTTALDLMLALIRAQHGHYLALDVASQFIYEQERLGSDPQRGITIRQLEHHAPALAKALEIMESGTEEPHSIPEIAHESGVSQKELERLFQRHLQTPPARYYRTLRLTHANRMMHNTGLSLAEISLRCGFNSPSAFSRAYRRHFGHSPTSERL